MKATASILAKARNHNLKIKMEVGPLGFTVASIGYFREDVRFAARQFRRSPAYAIFATLVLALGIGTVTAMFTISYGVLMKPLPFRADRQLFDVVESTGWPPPPSPRAALPAWTPSTRSERSKTVFPEEAYVYCSSPVTPRFPRLNLYSPGD